MTESVVDVQGITKVFRSRVSGRDHVAVDDVSFSVQPGETFGIVGESGSGKTTVARMLLRLVRPTSGTVEVTGIDVWGARRRERRALPGRIQVVFQDPQSSMNPRFTISQVLLEGTRLSPRSQEGRSEASRLLELVGLPARYVASKPHQLSGGQRQRVAIARSLAMNPRVLVADEPVSALDVSIRGQILNLLSELQASLGLTCVFISHDLGVVSQYCDRVIVMCRGRIVESGDPAEIFQNPEHEYTRLLVASVPTLAGGDDGLD